ncbi:MAG: hypothetical protein COZ06_30330 [Armatimonadetes bacterium CG_4_10_14_3_um_filter_66_18]|nr:hypothetical protein [Armatimonadota bacterium]OIP06380.1 MAG: hypothetical protein AUJ96_09275 [Armatimonadetes bacterium CG2_30_66_41]PIU92909.1 MAG: hypothetical protein COS65_15460 [Armatimonadetes bacterium CG06_land_8_20_14_3_00_66_21]PIX39124.1 MAG: hypothetical protein COZ57_28900 [Armatimonadetes bacterium CG_4_8_14_3_um_filter_66_20]PIY39019.1 MAG: hypothetical protein COZ06_30330 [Armatimonadetes bacterium CG_4_10_14_3_um_filter_66_18]PIZ34241.1 MAG: hypothetical protein COY42_28
MCAAELPQIEAVVNAFGDAVNIVIIVPTYGEGSLPKDMLPHFAKAKHKYNVLLDDGANANGETVWQTYRAGTGQWYVIDKGGILRAAGQQGVEAAAEKLSKRTGRPPVKLPELANLYEGMPDAGSAPPGGKPGGKGKAGAKAAGRNGTDPKDMPETAKVKVDKGGTAESEGVPAEGGGTKGPGSAH